MKSSRREARFQRFQIGASVLKAVKPRVKSMKSRKKRNAIPRQTAISRQAAIPRLAAMLVAMSGLAMFGCSAPEPEFRFNEAYLRLQEVGSSDLGENRDRVKQNIKEILVGLYGTPNEPHLPPIEGLSDLVDIENLHIAAGPAQSIQDGTRRGLYREHCAHCHGITGDGRGPTAEFLNPYPRDYREGTYKFKSTPRKDPPTNDDLQRILHEGIPGTAMPSFRLLKQYEVDALVDYVRYLSIRGQTERWLIEYVMELEEDQDVAWGGSKKSQMEMKGYLTEGIGEIVASHLTAKENVLAVPAPPENWETPESISRGRTLFAGTLAACSTCHGPTALGDGQLTGYDDWTKSYYDPTVKNPKDKGSIEIFHEKFAPDHTLLDPRPIRPRNLRMNVFRGGRRPVDLYWRVKNGIAGTPMPASSDALSSDDVWHLIAYVRNLPYEELSEPTPLPKYQRERH